MGRAKTTTEALLDQWGKWSREGMGSMGSSSAMQVAMQLVEASNNRLGAAISDEQALIVERAVRILRSQSVEQAYAIELYFVRGLGEVEVAMRMGVSLVRAQKVLSRAIGWLDCAINNFSKAA